MAPSKNGSVFGLLWKPQPGGVRRQLTAASEETGTLYLSGYVSLRMVSPRYMNGNPTYTFPPSCRTHASIP